MPVAWADRWPVLGRHEQAAEWLLDLARRGRARPTVDAHARCLAEYLDDVRAGRGESYFRN